MCVSILIKYIGWYLVIIVNLHHYGCLVYIFTGVFLNGNPNIFDNSQYHCWLKGLGVQFLPIIVNTTHDNVNFLNQVKG